jgi:drug/metabolite transporter (DMT)-like permease
MGIINNVVPFSLIFWAQQEIGAGLAAVLNATTPLFTLILAHLLTRDEPLKPNALAGILLGMAGVAILVGPAGLHSFGAPVLPQLAVLGAAFSYGLAGIWGRRLRGYPALTSACCQLTGSSLVLLPAMLLLDRPWTLPMPSQTVIAAMIALALVCTALAYVIFFTIVKRAGATNVMLVTLLIPPSAIGLGAIVLGETLDAREIAGAAVILVGLLIIDGRALRALITPMRRTR